MNILAWIIFGLVAGVIAQLTDPQPGTGILGGVILGILGAVIGGFLGNFVFGVSITGFNISSLAIAALGALLLLFVSRVIHPEGSGKTSSNF